MWELHENRNCYWDGHGAEEVDSPQGSSVHGVHTLDDCKQACVDSEKRCDGIIYLRKLNVCYRKADIDVKRCPPDGKLDLYIRIEPNRPPAAPWPDHEDKFLSGAQCRAMMRDPHSKFHGFWGVDGWTWRNPGEASCYGNGGWFDWVSGGHNCNQNWGPNLKAPTVFGFPETMEAFCNHHAGHGWHFEHYTPQWACPQAGLNVLRIDTWNMCRNVEWIVCLIQGKANRGGGGDGQILFTFAPSALDLDGFNSRPNSYVESDIYFVEICILSEACANGEELFSLGIGEPWYCQWDDVKWSGLKSMLLGK
jgi:hypothetical protein